MAIGFVAALLRNLPGQIKAFLERRVSLSLEIPDRDPAFRWIQSWLSASFCMGEVTLFRCLAPRGWSTKLLRPGAGTTAHETRAAPTHD